MLINCETCFTFLLMRFLLVSLGNLGMDLESFRLLGGFEYPNEMYNTNRYDLMFFCVLFCDVKLSEVTIWSVLYFIDIELIIWIYILESGRKRTPAKNQRVKTWHSLQLGRIVMVSFWFNLLSKLELFLYDYFVQMIVTRAKFLSWL